ncbi:hypothetical protein D3C85_1657780 [compost metagenome]
MEDCPAAQIHRQFTFEFDEASVSHVAAGDQLPSQVNHVADIELCEIFVLDRCVEDFNHRTTPSWERMS